MNIVPQSFSLTITGSIENAPSPSPNLDQTGIGSFVCANGSRFEVTLAPAGFLLRPIQPVRQSVSGFGGVEIRRNTVNPPVQPSTHGPPTLHHTGQVQQSPVMMNVRQPLRNPMAVSHYQSGSPNHRSLSGRVRIHRLGVKPNDIGQSVRSHNSPTRVQPHALSTLEKHGSSYRLNIKARKVDRRVDPPRNSVNSMQSSAVTRSPKSNGAFMGNSFNRLSTIASSRANDHSTASRFSQSDNSDDSDNMVTSKAVVPERNHTKSRPSVKRQRAQIQADSNRLNAVSSSDWGGHWPVVGNAMAKFSFLAGRPDFSKDEVFEDESFRCSRQLREAVKLKDGRDKAGKPYSIEELAQNLCSVAECRVSKVSYDPSGRTQQFDSPTARTPYRHYSQIPPEYIRVLTDRNIELTTKKLQKCFTKIVSQLEKQFGKARWNSLQSYNHDFAQNESNDPMLADYDQNSLDQVPPLPSSMPRGTIDQGLDQINRSTRHTQPVGLPPIGTSNDGQNSAGDLPGLTNPARQDLAALQPIATNPFASNSLAPVITNVDDYNEELDSISLKAVPHASLKPVLQQINMDPILHAHGLATGNTVIQQFGRDLLSAVTEDNIASGMNIQDPYDGVTYPLKKVFARYAGTVNLNKAGKVALINATANAITQVDGFSPDLDMRDNVDSDGDSDFTDVYSPRR